MVRGGERGGQGNFFVKRYIMFSNKVHDVSHK